MEASADVVFAARTLDPSAARAVLGADDAQAVALVNVSGLIAERSDLTAEHVELVTALRRRGLAVVLLPPVWRERAGDAAACAAVMAELERTGHADGVHLVEDQLSPAQVRGLTARATVTVTGRMHLAVMSLVHGVPAITLATQGKVEGLMALVGTPRLVLDPAPGLAARALELVDEVLPPEALARDAVAASRGRVADLARRNVDGLPQPGQRPPETARR